MGHTRILYIYSYFSLIVWLKFKAEHNKYRKDCKIREKADYCKIKQIGLPNQTQ